MAIKILDIAGEEPFLQSDKGARDQDFLMINTPAFAFSDIPDYLHLNKILLENNDDPSAFFAPLADPSTCPQSVIFSFKVIQEIKTKPVENPLGVQYFGAAPFLFGPDRVMKFSVKPSAGVKLQQVPTDAGTNYLNTALISEMAEQQKISFDFMIQVRSQGESDLGIEDATSRWDENSFPFVSVATITITAPQPDIDNAEHEANCENLIFTPWHALASHQPLGGINRLRKDVYSASSQHRGADNSGAICRFASQGNRLIGGNAIINRAGADTWENFYSIDTNNAINSDGMLHQWSLYAKNQNPVQLVIYRRNGDAYDVIGKSGVETPVPGTNHFYLQQYIAVATGDLVGWYYPRQGSIAFVLNSGPALYNDLNGSVVFSNQGSGDTAIQYSSFRTYSIGVLGVKSSGAVIRGGNDIVERGGVDTWGNYYSIDTNNAINSAGTLSHWSLYAKNQNPVQLVIYRRSDQGFHVIGKSGVETPVVGANNFTLGQKITVAEGDLVGWYYPRQGSIAFIKHSGPALYTDLSAPFLCGNQGAGETAIQYSGLRTYSIEVIGQAG